LLPFVDFSTRTANERIIWDERRPFLSNIFCFKGLQKKLQERHQLEKKKVVILVISKIQSAVVALSPEAALPVTRLSV